MVNPSPAETERDPTPKSFPEVTPSYQQAVGAGYLTESIMQMQATLGELKSDVKHLTAASDKQSGKLDKISHIIFAAGAILALVITVAGFLLNKIWDGLVLVMKAAGH